MEKSVPHRQADSGQPHRFFILGAATCPKLLAIGSRLVL
jgi:hypothetical protein